MSICDKCIHDDVCGLEDNHEEGIVSCADMIPQGVLEKIKDEIIEKFASSNCAEESGCLDQLLEIIDKYKGEQE